MRHTSVLEARVRVKLHQQFRSYTGTETFRMAGSWKKENGSNTRILLNLSYTAKRWHYTRKRIRFDFVPTGTSGSSPHHSLVAFMRFSHRIDWTEKEFFKLRFCKG